MAFYFVIYKSFDNNIPILAYHKVIENPGEIHYGVLGVILNLYREGRSVDTTIQSDIQRYYPFEIFKNTIPESVNAKKAVLGGLIYSQVYAKARDSYTKLAKEIEKQIKKMEKEAVRSLCGIFPEAFPPTVIFTRLLFLAPPPSITLWSGFFISTLLIFTLRNYILMFF